VRFLQSTVTSHHEAPDGHGSPLASPPRPTIQQQVRLCSHCFLQGAQRHVTRSSLSRRCLVSVFAFLQMATLSAVTVCAADVCSSPIVVARDPVVRVARGRRAGHDARIGVHFTCHVM
jgi:hypothetical protein